MKFIRFDFLLGLLVTVFFGTPIGVAVANDDALLDLLCKICAGVAFAFFMTSIIAAIYIQSSKAPDRAKELLQSQNYRKWYESSLETLLRWGWKHAGIAEPKGDERVFGLFKGALTQRLADRAMLIAVVYPILLMVLPYALFNSDVTLGQTVLLSAAPKWWIGALTLSPIVIFFLVRFALKRFVKSDLATAKRFSRSFSQWLNKNGYLDLVALALALAVAFADAVAGAVAVAVAVAVAGAGAVATAGAGAIQLLSKLRPKAATFLALTSPLFLLIVGMVFGISQSSEEVRAIFLFFGIAPAVNALFDTLSYAATMALSARGHRSYPILWGLIDAFCAAVLFLCLGGVLVAYLSFFERISGTALVDLGGLLAQAGDFKTYWWLYAMLFSTALPTLLHLGVASLSLRRFFVPEWQGWFAREIEKARDTPTSATSCYRLPWLGSGCFVWA